MKNLNQNIFSLIEKEKERQLNGIELIASENYVSDNVLKATGSVLTNKYLKVIQVRGIMVVVKLLMKLKKLPLKI